MSITMHALAIPDLLHALNNLSNILNKGLSHAEARNIDPNILLQSRLFPDMFPLLRQVQIATDVAKACGARLTGTELPKYPDTEASFPELQARVQKVIDYLSNLDVAAFTNAETRAINFKAGSHELSMQGMNYLLRYVKPNVYFHITTAYAILRHNGVELGKRDFLGAL